MIKWFSGGSDRSKEALNLIDELMNNLNNINNKCLIETLISYKQELEQKSTSVPYILSRFNLDIAKSIKSDNQILSNEQRKIIKQLTALSNIRYGY
jgi:hypothetical protein